MEFLYWSSSQASDVDYTSIAVDSNNDFHVVAHDHNGDELYYYGPSLRFGSQ